MPSSNSSPSAPAAAARGEATSAEPVLDLGEDEVGELLGALVTGVDPSLSIPSRWAIDDHRPIVAVPRSVSVSSNAALNVAEASGVFSR